MISRLTGTAEAIVPRPAVRFEPEFPGSENTAYDMEEERGEKPGLPPPAQPVDRDAVISPSSQAEPGPGEETQAEIMPPSSAAGVRSHPDPAFQVLASPALAVPVPVLSDRASLPPDQSVMRYREPAVGNRTQTRTTAPRAEPATAPAEGVARALPPGDPVAGYGQSPAPLPIPQSVLSQNAVPVPVRAGGPAPRVALPVAIPRPTAPPAAAGPPSAKFPPGATPGHPAERGLRPLQKPYEGRGSSRDRSAPPQPGPTVEVTIGRIEIRGPATAVPPPARRRAVDPSHVSALPEYLARRRRTS
ncbi:hypothetical protein QF031_000030 [Pseudarthrobacter defluvii]|nr:hypothetical protein [Pseudarthrobacter defluvii]